MKDIALEKCVLLTVGIIRVIFSEVCALMQEKHSLSFDNRGEEGKYMKVKRMENNLSCKNGSFYHKQNIQLSSFLLVLFLQTTPKKKKDLCFSV